jgi:hypothetical protein
LLSKPYDAGTIEIINQKIIYYTDSGITGQEPIHFLKPETYFKEDGRISDPKPLTPEDFHLTENECHCYRRTNGYELRREEYRKAIKEAQDAFKLDTACR